MIFYLWVNTCNYTQEVPMLTTPETFASLVDYFVQYKDCDGHFEVWDAGP